MSNLNWYKPLEQCATLDEVRARWRDLLEQNQMAPANPTPGYQDAIGYALLVLILLIRPSGLLGKVGYA